MPRRTTDPMSQSAPKYDYEKLQSFNRIVAWLHGFRYKNIYDVFQTLAAEITDRPIRVVEIGCAHAKLYQLLNDRFRIHSTGAEINPPFAEHAVVRIVENIARQRPRLFVCSVPVEVGPIIWIKNVGSWLMGYLRHTEYRWHETLWAGLYQLDRLPPHGTGHKGFDWRWLAQTIRHNLRIVEFRRLPARLLPAGLSTSVFFVARPREEEH